MEFRNGHSGEIVVEVRFITGAVGESPPEEILRKLAEHMTTILRGLQTEGETPPLASWAFQVAGATYDSHQEGGEKAQLDSDGTTYSP